MATCTIEEGLIYLLQNTAGVSALVSSRVYGMRIPQSATLPCLTVTRISTPRLHSHDSSGTAGTAHPRIQLDAWGQTQASVKAISDAARAALNGYKGTITITGGNTVNVQAALVDDEAPEYDGETQLYRSRTDYIIWHEEV